ncbi:MAG: hypothetical protein COA78_32745 [Blastopirellula sp.]|nr:MAG: hypothetical protein COA78_32745 [Blastopirellula sp.]
MNQPTDENNQPIQFRIVQLMYIIAVLSISMATFGTELGLFVGTLFSCLWGGVFISRTRLGPGFIASIFMLFFLIGMILPALQGGRQPARWLACSHNMKQLGFGLHNYHDTYGSFPPAYITDANGKPMHSWRVLILPFLEQEALYKQYDFNEPWNGPNNSKLLNQMPKVFECVSSDHHFHRLGSCTSYVAVVGPKTAWPEETGSSLPEFTDGTSNTILLIESNEACIPWLAPTDLNYDTALAQLCSLEHEKLDGHQCPEFFYQYSIGRNVLKTDGSIEYMLHGIERTAWEKLLGKSDGVIPNGDDYPRRYDLDETNTSRLKIANCVRFLFFVLIVVLLPLPWVWRKPVSTVVDSNPNEIDQESA